MLSRTFTVDHSDGTPLLCYKGFNKQFDGDTFYIALIRYDGEIDIWALDDSAHARAELTRYYENLAAGEFELVGIFLNTRMLR